MANTCDCAIALEKDEEKLARLGINRVNHQDGYYYRYSYKTMDGREVEVAEVVGGGKYEKTILVDGKESTVEPMKASDTLKMLVDMRDNHGWRIDHLKAGFYSYSYEAEVQEYEDHITIYFGARWSFPKELEQKLNSMDIRWQGAEAEGGCEVLGDELGNEDFGLRAKTEKDEEGYDNYFVEDTSENNLTMKGL